SGILAVPFIIGGVVFGVSAAIVVPDAQTGLIAIPLYLMEVLPAPLVGLFFLGVWACALGWGGPCQFLGSTSLGREVGGAIRPEASESPLIVCIKIYLLIFTVFMIILVFIFTNRINYVN